MKAKSIKQAAVLCVVILAALACTETMLGMTIRGYAEESVSSEDILGQACAGAAEVLEDVEPTEEEIEEIREANWWKAPGTLVMADVNDSVNVRLEPDEESERVGKLYKDCGGYIIEYTEEWTKLQSGNVVGWVYNEYLIFGNEAQALADEVGGERATITADSLRVREEASTDAGVMGMVEEGDEFEVVEVRGDWIVINYEGGDGYISSEYATTEYHIDHGETVEEIEEREAAEAAAEREAARHQYYGVYAAQASDVELLGALIQCEAGNQPYEGMVAVGAVVMNRVRSGAYPDTIYGVIYASGQFSPAGSGAVDRRLANGVNPLCIQAAQEAINGYSNVGNALHFRRAGYREGIVIGAHVFW